MSKILIHPGEILRDELKERGISQLDFSTRTGISKTIINEIIKGKRNISPEYAVEFESVLEIDAIFWVNSQSAYSVANIKMKRENDYQRGYKDGMKDGLNTHHAP